MDFPLVVEDIRRRIFALEDDDEVSLSPSDFKTYWPFVSNIWSANGNTHTIGTVTTSWFRCRLFRCKNWVPLDESRPRQRQKPSRAPVSCGMRMRVVSDGSRVLFKRTGNCSQHSHSLEDIDRSKRPVAILDLAAKQVANGYTVADVWRSFSGADRPEDQKALYSIGGRFLCRHDIHNASAAQKKQLLKSKSPGYFKDKVIVLTGGAKGIGAVTVQLLNKAGAAVVFGDCDDSSGQKLVTSLCSEHVHFLRIDVTSYEDNIALFKLALQIYGKADHAMAMAGITEQGNWFDPSLTVESVEQLPPTISLDVNLLGILYFARIASVYLRQNRQPGHDRSLLLLSSIAGFKESPGLFICQTAKHGVLGLMHSLRPYLPVTTGIRVNAICPWMTTTELSVGIEEAWHAAQPPFNQPMDVAKICLDVTLSPNVHGKTLYVEGGRATEVEDTTTNRLEPYWLGAEQSRVFS